MAGLRSLLLGLVALALIGAAVAHAHPEANDLDGDSVLNDVDNCLTVPNGSQLNTDGAADGGDACDTDDDNDGDLDNADNCRLVFNPGQEGAPYPARGDACPALHSDSDGINDDDDNCDLIANPDQHDLDGDDQGDACDRDDDNDRIDDGFDNCPTVYNPEYPQIDLDGDGIGSACDAQELIGGAAGAGGGVPAGAAGAASNDRSAPRVTVAVGRRQRLSDSGRSLVVTVTCSEACSLRAELAADARAARRARLGRLRVVLARGSWSLAGRGRTYVFARWTPAARRLRAGRRASAVLRLTATDAAGNRRTVTRAVELRR